MLEIQVTSGRNLGYENETQQTTQQTTITEKQPTVTLQDILDKLSVIDRIVHKLDNLFSRNDMLEDQQTALPVPKQVDTTKNILVKEARRMFTQTEISVGQQSSNDSFTTNQQRAPLLMWHHNSSTLTQNLVKQEIHIWINFNLEKYIYKRKRREGKQYGYKRKKKSYRQTKKYWNWHEILNYTPSPCTLHHYLYYQK